LTDPVPAIELLDATKRYGEAVALDHVSLEIGQGEFFCLLGPSGCGKTTTLNLIGGFVPLTSGELRIEGVPVGDLPPHKRNVNTVFQSYALFPHMTVAGNVAFGLRMEGLPPAEVTTRIDQYLELVGLAGFGDRLPSQLSGGQQQRVALARALAKRPAVLLLDEPLGALDLKLRKQMQTELARIHRQVGTTFVFVTHDQEEALSMATRVAIMANGRVAQVGSPREIYERPVDRFVADFVGETNFLDGRVRASDPRPVFEPAGGGVAIAAPGGAAAGPATLMIRPEYLHVDAAGAAPPDAGLEGHVVNVAFLGAYSRVSIATTAGELVAVHSHDGGPDPVVAVGEEVCVWWPPDRAAVLSP
jgi:spermidine/putrescine transport system ATP-binding protein